MKSRPFLNYGHQTIDDDDVAAVSNALRGDFLTTGPLVERFEMALAKEVGAEHAIVCSNGTAALYLAARAAGIETGDSVIVPAMTFVSTASASILAGIEVIFADVNPNTGLMEIEHAAEALHRGGKDRVKAIYPVHLAGKVSDPAALYAFAEGKGLSVIEDACHALGTRYGNAANQVGECAHSLAACFSFHPVKAIAMGEGGAITTNSSVVAERCRRLRNHGMSKVPERFENRELAFSADHSVNPWYYEVDDISFNFRASDINCALGLSQLSKLNRLLSARRNLMAHYQRRLASLPPEIRLTPPIAGVEPGWHLCPILVDFEALGIDRFTLMRRLKERGVGTQVHYLPVNLHPFFRKRYGEIDLPGAMAYYRRTLSLPLFPGMSEGDVEWVVDALEKSIGV
jgi:UDP-4-amino-4,6-dideoxy-N-acetyl-beta-L-altrosamine transaminase